MMCLVHSASPSHGLAWQERSTEITSDLLIPISKHIQVRRVPRECSLHYSISTLNIFSSIFVVFLYQLDLGGGWNLVCYMLQACSF